MIKNVNYLRCIFMKFNENCKKKKDRTIVKTPEVTFRPKLSLCHFVVDPVKSNDKFIDIMGLYENNLICIFMNINKNVENLKGKKRGKTMVIARFWMGYKISWLPVWSEGPPKSLKILSSTIYTFAYLHDINFHSFNTHP